jgi:hypothetical protein
MSAANGEVDSSQVDTAPSADCRRNDEFNNVFAQETTLLIRSETPPSLTSRDLIGHDFLVERDLRLKLIYAAE